MSLVRPPYSLASIIAKIHSCWRKIWGWDSNLVHLNGDANHSATGTSQELSDCTSVIFSFVGRSSVHQHHQPPYFCLQEKCPVYIARNTGCPLEIANCPINLKDPVQQNVPWGGIARLKHKEHQAILHYNLLPDSCSVCCPASKSQKWPLKCQNIRIFPPKIRAKISF